VRLAPIIGTLAIAAYIKIELITVIFGDSRGTLLCLAMISLILAAMEESTEGNIKSEAQDSSPKLF
jgi:hypothetical protein